MRISEDDYLMHYGMPRRSGRYPWGTSGWGKGEEETPYQANKRFLDEVSEMKKAGLSDPEIAKYFGGSTTDLVAWRSIARNEVRAADISRAVGLKQKGHSNSAIGRIMGKNESVIRSYLKAYETRQQDVITSTANELRKAVKDKKFIDVGAGVEHYMNISPERLRAAIAVLKTEGYQVHTFKEQQLGTSHQTRFKILVPPNTTYKELLNNKDKIQQVMMTTEDGGMTWNTLQPPLSINSDRIKVVYAEDGGSERDGMMFVRPGVEDISLGGATYAQVRVAVDNSHYLKGMAVYNDDLPQGVDIVFYTNKSDTGNKLDALKKFEKDVYGKVDPNNPFGAQIKAGGQILKPDPKDPTKQVVSSAMNLVNEEGDWTEWSRNLSSQMLSKQSPTFAKEQLELTYLDKLQEYHEISELTNPTVKRKLLESFSDSVDSDAVVMSAAAIPGQAYHVIMPITSMDDSRVYAPNYKDGTRLALIRYPHGGTFEIPDLIVDNSNKEAKKLLGDAKDVIGINHRVAERLSGADFDGDQVVVLPNNKGKIKSTPALDGLKNFDPRDRYPKYEGMEVMTSGQKQQLMGQVTNLIADMTIKGASSSEIARAVRHSMVVIDAEKHELNYKQSYEDNNIRQLRVKYQGGPTKGASTLITRATSPKYIPERKDRTVPKGGPIDKKTGRRMYEETGSGRMMKVDRLALETDAHKLSSGTRIERIYADHSNRLKALANRARLEMLDTPKLKASPSARRAYAPQVTSLAHKLKESEKNAPLERQALLIGNAMYRMKLEDNPDMSEGRKKKLKGAILTEARSRTGANKPKIHITDDEWEAIQAGAISDTRLSKILQHADEQRVKELATPRKNLLMTTSKTSRAKAMLAAGYTRAQVAAALGVSVSTLDRAMA